MMRRFLYYLPDTPGANDQMLAARGLGNRFLTRGGAVSYCVTGIADGPAGTGCIVAAGTRPPTVDFAQQRWLPGPRYWTGVEEAALPPRPHDLVKDLCISGYELKLGDGNEWRVPLLRCWDPRRFGFAPNLPMTIQAELAGERYVFREAIAPEYAEWDALGETLLRLFMGQGGLPLGEAFEHCARLLAINYRVGVEEASLLGLFSADLAMPVIELAIDLPALRAQAVAAADRGLEISIVEEED